MEVRNRWCSHRWVWLAKQCLEWYHASYRVDRRDTLTTTPFPRKATSKTGAQPLTLSGAVPWRRASDTMPRPGVADRKPGISCTRAFNVHDRSIRLPRSQKHTNWVYS
ncbi:hypothetical protein SCLCIDRAFT_875414 [Scleroderma citrinum Foug A]|uniref:Uncharacterized protein n=1 Tax=Scleroderma citrinum Foug A TaxID=1036808 RepID=A0A0C3DZ84_9AGAM|nr:hypothetical protein SCLCIDRAFT_875414 [Scleroderma citrinum Foug A]